MVDYIDSTEHWEPRISNILIWSTGVVIVFLLLLLFFFLYLVEECWFERYFSEDIAMEHEPVQKIIYHAFVQACYIFPLGQECSLEFAIYVVKSSGPDLKFLHFWLFVVCMYFRGSKCFAIKRSLYLWACKNKCWSRRSYDLELDCRICW